MVLALCLTCLSTVLAFELKCKPDVLHITVNKTAECHCALQNILKTPLRKNVWTKGNITLYNYSSSAAHHSWAVDSRHQLLMEEIKHGNLILKIRNTQISDNGTYKCIVLFDEAYRDAEVHVFLTAVPKLSLFYETSVDDPSVLTLTCIAEGFYPSDITLSWVLAVQEVPHSRKQTPATLLQDGTYIISSTLQVKDSLWSPEVEIGCKANHSSLTQPLMEKIRKKGSHRRNHFIVFSLLGILGVFTAALIMRTGDMA
ncbi:signal-regulatory protein gamma-like [Polypterus senegalus]|uniref:signal-regulatory protein gamma-like n=1 Tax=Polypterus senegalus TaxID=55291 RepID=UPI001964A439|nr:signal-regulatory protein gamma-like [Polypterus senegalus]